MRLFQRGGERGVSMRLLASELGISTMALYNYFPTKAHLMHHIWADMLRLACAQGEHAASASRCDWSRLDACLQGFLSYWVDHPDHLRQILAAWQTPGDGADARPWFRAPRIQLDQLLRPLSGRDDGGALLDDCRNQVLSQVLGTQMLLLARGHEPRAARLRLVERMARVTVANLRTHLGAERVRAD